MEFTRILGRGAAACQRKERLGGWRGGWQGGRKSGRSASAKAREGEDEEEVSGKY